MSEIDWSALQTEAATAGLLPDGDYNVVIVSAASASTSTGKPMVKVKFRVTDGPQKDKPVWSQFVISAETPMALRIFFQHMAALGLDAAYFSAKPSMEQVAASLMNRAAVVTLGTRAWNGQDRNEVKGIKAPATGGPVAPGVVTGPVAVLPSAAGIPSPLSASPPVPSTAPAPTVPAAPVGTGLGEPPPAKPF